MKRSAGILLYRRGGSGLELLLVHPGGPFWRGKDAGAWSIPKGEIAPGGGAEETALREFEEELGSAPEGNLVPLGTVRQAGGKEVEAFALEGEFDCAAFVSNMFEMEWPPRSGRIQSFPEIDRAAWFDPAAARTKINPAQAALIERLEALLGSDPAGDGY